VIHLSTVPLKEAFRMEGKRWFWGGGGKVFIGRGAVLLERPGATGKEGRSFLATRKKAVQGPVWGGRSAPEGRRGEESMVLACEKSSDGKEVVRRGRGKWAEVGKERGRRILWGKGKGKVQRIGGKKRKVGGRGGREIRLRPGGRKEKC